MPRRRALRPRLLAAVLRSNATWAFAAERQVVRQTAAAQMIECLIKDQRDGFDVNVDILERAMRPSIPHTVGPGRWTIDVGGDRFVDFSPEGPGLQVSFDDGIERALAERVATDVVANLTSLTGARFHVVWLS